MRHSDDLNSLFIIIEAGVDLFKTIGILEYRNGIDKIDTVLAKIRGRLAIVPFVLHTLIVPDTGTSDKRRRELTCADAVLSVNEPCGLLGQS